MRLGVATSIPWLPGKSQERCFLDALAEAEMAEALGFDALWFTEHHFRPARSQLGPHGMAGAVAMRTWRVRIGSTVFVLPSHPP